MLNPVIAVQTQIQTKQPLSNGNDFTRPNKSEDKQFNNILAREATEKKSSQASEHTANTKNDRVSESKETSSIKKDAADETDINDTLNTANATNTTDSPNEPIQGSPLVANQYIAADQATQIIGAENISDIEIMPVLQEATTAILSSSQLNINNSTPSYGLGTNPTPSLLSPQSGLQQGNKVNLLENNGLWQPLQAADSADSGKILPFSTEVNKEILAKLSEPSALFSKDTDALHQPGLSNMTQTIAQSTTQTAIPHNLNLETQIGQPKWNGDFAQKIVWLATQQHQVAELRLNPAHLGPVEIMLSLTHENGTQASAQFVSPHLAVREAIESALPRLRELMAESGIQLGDVMVGAESFQHQGQGEQHAHPFARGARIFSTNDESSSNSEMKIISNRHNGIVNTFA